ncbi:uncharacterized protein LOC134187045 [Corticium candelabrum]|uniref:uncharacterized protein LOC134187045 n=1 Tax=Corticium candelabrum TaxID=121492 RepID=UPI002E25C8DE|nr:uncharacterized protein LOC134187045 [Corticium candelabrum]
MSIQRGSHETVSAYCSRFQRTLLQLQSCQDCALPDLTIVTWFQEGLRPEFQMELERDQPTKFVDAVHSAEKAERISQRNRIPVDDDHCFVVRQSHLQPRSRPQQHVPDTKPPTASSFHSNVDGAQSTDREVFQQLILQLILQQSQILAQQGEFLKLLQPQSSSSRNSAASSPSSGFRAKEANSRPPPQTTSSAYNQRQLRTTPSQVNRGLSTEQ